MSNGYHLSVRSQNQKTGSNCAVTTSTYDNCSDNCGLKQDGTCYAQHGKLAMHWRKVTGGERGGSFEDHLSEITQLGPAHYLRINQAGDLPKSSALEMDHDKCLALAEACKGKVAWTYTHHAPHGANIDTIRAMADAGLVTNLSGDNPAHAIELHTRTGIDTVSVVDENFKSGATIDGVRFVVCPAQLSDKVSCAGGTVRGKQTQACGGSGLPLCARRNRGFVVAFRVHGAGKKNYQQPVEA